MSEAVITCENVCIAYGRQEVLHDVYLSVHRGAFLPFVGPNGAGKTTLLRAILGSLKPCRGRITTPFKVSPPGYVPQFKAIDPIYPVTTWQIVAMGLYPRVGWWRRLRHEERTAIDTVLDEFGLLSHAGKTFMELSGGMKQKALIARAFASGAEVFVMDEPTSELDEASERDVFAHLLRISQAEGKTVLLAHHGLDDLAVHADTVCLVNHGRVQLVPASEIDHRLERPTPTRTNDP